MLERVNFAALVRILLYDRVISDPDGRKNDSPFRSSLSKSHCLSQDEILSLHHLRHPPRLVVRLCAVQADIIARCATVVITDGR